MNDQIKQPIVITKIDNILDLVNKLSNMLEPVLNILECGLDKNVSALKNQSLTLEKLDNVYDRLSFIIDKIDIN